MALYVYGLSAPVCFLFLFDRAYPYTPLSYTISRLSYSLSSENLNHKDTGRHINGLGIRMYSIYERRKPNFRRHCRPLDLTPPSTLAPPHNAHPATENTKTNNPTPRNHQEPEIQIELTSEGRIELLQFEASLGKSLTPNEYSHISGHIQQGLFEFKPEQSQGFEPYITSKGAPQKWIDQQRERRHKITCKHLGPPRTPHPSVIFVPSVVQ